MTRQDTPPEAPDRRAGRRAAWRYGGVVAAAFTVLVVALSVVVALSTRAQRRQDPELLGPSWLDGWYQYDAAWYLGIVRGGYSYSPGQQSSVAFFPAYPLSVGALGDVLGDHQVAGQLLTVLCGLVAVVLFALWARRRLPRRSAVMAVAVLLLYPYAFFLYGPMYADALFLLSAVLAFVLLERRWYLAAGLVGAVATAGRPVGVAVAVGLVVRTLEILAEDRRAAREAASEAGSEVASVPASEVVSEAGGAVEAVAPGGVDAAPVRPGWRDLVAAVRDVRLRHVGVLVSGLGLVGWCVYLWLAFGHPLAFVEVESAPGWNQGVGPRTWFKIVYAGTLIKGPYDVALLLTLQALACLCAVLLLRRVQRLFGWGYAAFTAVVLLIPIIGTKDFMGTGRYVLVAFPVLAAAGDFLATRSRRWVAPVTLVVCGILLVVLTFLFGRGVAVS
ncbi:glycosyltransferase family 39 protein [Cellulomonas sp. S1-8]|uniref:glycosyltransferase family 39 protein n=1 Tax=Cellulomonas sp. S1-8 TaxID=2904790 RepID=UPI002244756E|nr:glycosyltransferase family 39 protein [Cellulomonas sp. S1-8]UZN03002.1 glycosyltransferase family 39 protein [Cellulomonas sp. S1-8]